MYAQFPLNNKHFAYQLDLSNVPCHCNAAAYFVDMPGNNPGDGDYYCDANHGNNIWCPEYDVMEGNKRTINTDNSFTISHFQTSSQANTWMGQGSNDGSFNMCNDGGYVSNMANSYGDMVFTASLWGGGGINMDWLD